MPNLPKCPVPVWKSVPVAAVTGIHIVPNLPKCPAPVWVSYRTYRSVRYRYRCCTEHTEVSGTGIDAVPNLAKCPVPVLILYRTYRSVRYRYGSLYRYRRYRYRYPYRTELTEVCGTGIDVVPKLPKCPVPVLMFTELTEVSGTGIDAVPNLPKCPVPVSYTHL